MLQTPGMRMAEPFVRLRGLTKRFSARDATGRRVSLTALDDVDLDLYQGETLGLVGESGCGKSTLARCVMRLIEPDAGSIRFDGVELMGLSQRALRPWRRRMQLVFQDPFASLNPRMTVRQMLLEPLAVHGVVAPADRNARLEQLLEWVGLGSDAFERYPHEFSGGQRQRLGIARSLAVEPDLLVADEPVSALDLSVRAQIMSLLGDLQSRLGLTCLLIAHDLQVIAEISHRVAVMYAGRIVEQGPAKVVLGEPAHPYTRALLASTPSLDPERPVPALLPGEPPSPLEPLPGCPFAPRCAVAESRCRDGVPKLVSVGEGHDAACILRI